MASPASRIAAAAAQVASAAAGLAAAATVLNGELRTTQEAPNVHVATITALATETKTPITPFEIFARANQSANKVFDTAELLEAILSCITDISTLFRLRRVSKAFKRATHGSVKIKERMFLLGHRRRPEQEMKDFAVLNPLLQEADLTPGPLKHFDFYEFRITDTEAQLTCDCATYFRSWDWKSIDKFLDCAEFDLGESVREPTKQSWQKLRILNVSMKLRVRFGDFLAEEVRDPMPYEFVLRQDRTLGDLLRKLCRYRDAVQAAYIDTTTRRFTVRD
ncbi:hypothetical protein LTR95_007522 [Oleoguttula sp. CCFEE 5521]